MDEHQIDSHRSAHIISTLVRCLLDIESSPILVQRKFQSTCTLLEEPTLGPLSEVHLQFDFIRYDCVFEAADEILQLRILPLILLEVHSDGIFDSVESYQVSHGLDPTGTLCIGDPIEHHHTFSCMPYWHLYRMGRHLEIRFESCLQEADANQLRIAVLIIWIILLEVLQTTERTEVSKTLLEPQIVPPLHGD